VKRFITLIALVMTWLVVSIPIIHAETLNLVTDANGNLVTGDGMYREYNSFNQLVNVRNGSNISSTLLQQFVHHPTEERIFAKRTFNSSGTITETVYYWTKTFVEVINTSGSYNFTYVYHEGQLIAQELQGTKLFIHGNHEGSSSVITNATGQVVKRTEYSPLGEVVAGGGIVRFDHEGKESDSVVGDTDFNFRKYKSEWGLFTQPDTLIQNVYDPQTLNHYMFERGNPYKNIDETGHDGGASFVLFVFAVFVIVNLAILPMIGLFKGESRGIDDDRAEFTSEDLSQDPRYQEALENSKFYDRNLKERHPPLCFACEQKEIRDESDNLVGTYVDSNPATYNPYNSESGMSNYIRYFNKETKKPLYWYGPANTQPEGNYQIDKNQESSTQSSGSRSGNGQLEALMRYWDKQRNKK